MARREQPPQEQSAGTGESGRGRSKRRGRAFKVLVLGGVVAFVAKPSMRSRVLDVLFGPEEQFDYESPTEPVAPDLQSEESQAGWQAQTGTVWPAPASEPSSGGGAGAESAEPGAWRFSQHNEWTPESSAAFGAGAAEEGIGEHGEVDEDFGGQGTFGGDTAPESHEPPPYQAGAPAEAPHSYETGGYGATGSDHEPAAYGATGSDHEPAAYGATASDHEPAAYGATASDHEPAGYGATASDPAPAGYGATDQEPAYDATASDPEPAGYGETGSDPDPAGYATTASDPEPAGYGATDPEPHSPWPPPAAGDPHDSDGAPQGEPPANESSTSEGPAIGEATPSSEADAPRGGWWLSRLRKEADPPPEPPRWD